MPTQPHKSFEEARAQNAEKLGFLASERITLPNSDTFEIPNPSLLDDDQQELVDALDIEAESWDRVDDVTAEDGTVTRGKGNLLVPNRKSGEQVENYNTQLAKALFGDRYAAFKAAGGRGNDVKLIWSRMQKEMAARRAADSKSAGSTEAVAPVADADSGGA